MPPQTRSKKTQETPSSLRQNVHPRRPRKPASVEKQIRMLIKLNHKSTQVRELEHRAEITENKLSTLRRREALGVYGDFLAQEVAVFRPHFEKAYTGPNGEKPDSTAHAMDDKRAQEEKEATNTFAGAAQAYMDEKVTNGM